MTTSTTRTITTPNGLAITVTEFGDPSTSNGTGALVLHGGAGPRSVAGFAAALSQHTHVVAPTHPGFDGTPRPETTDSIADLASAYLDLLDELGLTEVMVLGNSIGGWITAEMGVRDNHGRLAALVLIASTGIAPEAPLEIADPAKIGPVKTGELAFYNPAMRLDPTTLSAEQQAVMLANAQTQAVYGGNPYSHDPKLRGRLHRVTIPVLVLAGEEDGIVPLAYERTLADSFPDATFRTVAEAGHFPQIEQPAAVFAAIDDFVDASVKPGRARAGQPA